MFENQLSIQIQLIDRSIALSFFYIPLNKKFILGFQFSAAKGHLIAESNPSILNQFLFEEKIKDHNYNQLKLQIRQMFECKNFRNRIKELCLHKFCVELSYEDFYQQYLDFKPE